MRWVLFALLATAGTAHADPDDWEDMTFPWLQIGEVVMPDLRAEGRVDGDLAFVLAFPIHVHRGNMPIEHYLHPSDVRTWTAFIEPQVAVGEDAVALRLLAGARIWSKPGWGVGVEAGGVAGTDGLGGFVGATVGSTSEGEYDADKRSAHLLSLRLVAVDTGVRVDLGFDVAFYTQPQPDVEW